MINYLWVGLLVLAILYGGYREITSDPMSIEHKPKQLELKFINDPAQFATGSLTPTADVEFTLTEPASVLSVSVPVESNSAVEKISEKKNRKFNVSALELKLNPGDSTYRVQYQFTDADGELFLLDGGKLAPAKADEEGVVADPFVTKKLKLASAVPSAENLAASLDYPVELTQIQVRKTSDEDMDSTLIVSAQPQLTYEPFHIAEVEEGSGWMALLAQSVTKWSKISIDLAIGLIGIMMFWLGLMRIAEKAGLVQVVANLVKPIMIFLFPGINPKSEAMGAIVMNVAANMLGLGNAATPLGIKAMKELQKENKYKEYASNAQCMLLAINTSSVTLIPITVIGYRAATGSQNLLSFWPVMVMATLVSTFFAILATKILERMSIFAIPADAELNDGKAINDKENSDE